MDYSGYNPDALADLERRYGEFLRSQALAEQAGMRRGRIGPGLDMAEAGGPELPPPPSMQDLQRDYGAMGAGAADFGGLLSDPSHPTYSPGIAQAKAAAPIPAAVGEGMRQAANLPLAVGDLAIKGAKGVYDWWNDPGQDFTPKSREEWLKENATSPPDAPTPPTLNQFLDPAIERMESSDAYAKSNSAGKRRNMRRDVEQSAKAAYEAAQSQYQSQLQRFDAERQNTMGQNDTGYDRYVQDRKAEQQKFYDRPWMERFSPGMQNSMVAASYLAPALLARYGLGRIARSGDTLNDAVKTARTSGTFRDEAEALKALDKWERTAGGKRAATVGLSASIPLDVRLGGDVYDSKFLPENAGSGPGGAGAREAAKARLGRTFSMEGLRDDIAPALLTGGLSTALGAKFAPKGPGEKASATLGTVSDLRNQIGPAQVRTFGGYGPTRTKNISALEAMPTDDLGRALASRRYNQPPSPGQSPPANPPAGPSVQGTGNIAPTPPARPTPRGGVVQQPVVQTSKPPRLRKSESNDIKSAFYEDPVNVTAKSVIKKYPNLKGQDALIDSRIQELRDMAATTGAIKPEQQVKRMIAAERIKGRDMYGIAGASGAGAAGIASTLDDAKADERDVMKWVEKRMAKGMSEKQIISGWQRRQEMMEWAKNARRDAVSGRFLPQGR